VTHKFSRLVLLSASATVISMFTLAAAPCTPGTLADYVALGATGCSVGGDTFYNFQLVSNNGVGKPAIPAADITVEGLGPAGTPGASATELLFPNDIGVDFDAVWQTGAGQILDDDIAFDVSVGPGAATVTDAGIVQTSGIQGNGSVTVSEIGCSGIVFPCTQTWGVATNNTNFVSDTIFTSTGTLSVQKDIAVAGNDGTATLSNVADVFSSSPVPEPRSLSLLLGLGLVAGFVFRKKFQGASA
jgi:PEP-CTERM motif